MKTIGQSPASCLSSGSATNLQLQEPIPESRKAMPVSAAVPKQQQPSQVKKIKAPVKSVRSGSGDADLRSHRKLDQKSNRSQRSSLSKNKSRSNNAQKVNISKAKASIIRPLSSQLSSSSPIPDASDKSQPSQLGNIFSYTKEAIQKQRISTKLESTKKIILKNQEQIINKQ